MKSRRAHTKVSKKQEDIELAVEEFGRQAELPNSSPASSNPIKPVVNHRYRRYTFSLTEEISKQIDELSLTAARISRSDVVKAGILSLTKLHEADLKQLLKESKSS